MDDFFEEIGSSSQEIREKVKDVIRLLKYWKKVRTVGSVIAIDAVIHELV